MGKMIRSQNSMQSPIYCPNCKGTSEGSQTIMGQTTQPKISMRQQPPVQGENQMQQPSQGQGESQVQQQATSPPQQPTQRPARRVTLPGVHGAHHEVQMNDANIIIPPVPVEEAFFENILRLNIGRRVRVNTNVPGERNEYGGILSSAGNDYIIVVDTESGEVHVILSVTVVLVTFLETISLDTEVLARERGLFSTKPQST